MSAEVELLRDAAVGIRDDVANPNSTRFPDEATALAVADWLDQIAEYHKGVESVDVDRGECVVSTVAADFKLRTSARHILPALAVARAYLGEASDA